MTEIFFKLRKPGGRRCHFEKCLWPRLEATQEVKYWILKWGYISLGRYIKSKINKVLISDSDQPVKKLEFCLLTSDAPKVDPDVIQLQYDFFSFKLRICNQRVQWNQIIEILTPCRDGRLQLVAKAAQAKCQFCGRQTVHSIWPPPSLASSYMVKGSQEVGSQPLTLPNQ